MLDYTKKKKKKQRKSVKINLITHPYKEVLGNRVVQHKPFLNVANVKSN